MDFDFDGAKSSADKQKHGIDFIEARELREDMRRLEIPARTEDEERWLVIGKIGDNPGSPPGPSTERCTGSDAGVPGARKACRLS